MDNDFAQKIVETEKYIVHLLIYLLVALILIMPIATTTREKMFFYS